MKKILLTLAVAAFCVSASYAQATKGPKAKNTKAWNKKSNTTLVTLNEESAKGPEAKNKKSWKKDKANKAEVSLSATKKATGPAAKNSKPWNK